MTTPLKQFIKQFKSQYPKTTLTASLISINDGQYVVRAAISQDNQEIASGLAASIDVHIAEDKARERAIAILGIDIKVDREATPATDSSPADSSPAVAKAEVTKKAELTEERLAPQAITTPDKPTPKPAPKPTPTDFTADTEISITEVPLEVSPEEDDLGPPIDSVQEIPSSAEAQRSVATIALENFNTSATPVDLSDVIAQTDVELARLGWTSAQGREYLEKTYGKRSRQQLTDEELMSFLLYLEDIS